VSLLIATDLDGCLLDHATYRHDAAAEALKALRGQQIPLVLVSSKTRAEVAPLAEELGLRTPFIVENGGAVIIPVKRSRCPVGRGGLRRRRRRRARRALTLELGRRHDLLVKDLESIGRETGAGPRGLSSMTVPDVARLTGLPIEAARLALEREYDEPFVLDDASRVDGVRAAAERRGLTVTRGGRFFHLTGRNDKGFALRRLLTFLRRSGRRFETVGLGDAANDCTLLQAVDRPILMPRPDGALDPALVSALPQAERAPGPGPQGWNAAVLTVLAGGRLPANDGEPAGSGEGR